MIVSHSASTSSQTESDLGEEIQQENGVSQNYQEDTTILFTLNPNVGGINNLFKEGIYPLNLEP